MRGSAATLSAKFAAALLATLLCLAAAGNALAFNLTDSAGQQHRLADYRGKWVLVNFWATWCPPCVEEIPELSELAASRAELVVLGVALDYDDAAYVRRFAAEHGMAYPLVLGNRRLAAQIGKVPVLPATYLYNPKGKIVLRRLGPVTREQIEQIIDAAADAGRRT